MVLFIVILLFARKHFEGQEPTTSVPHSRIQNVLVKRVIDGDTIIVSMGEKEKVRLRLIGIDTPETVHPRKPVQPFGKEASHFTKRSLEGRWIELELETQTHDRYGRLLAHVWLNGQHFNLKLVEVGLARVMTVGPNRKYEQVLGQVEQEARRRRIGMWSA